MPTLDELSGYKEAMKDRLSKAKKKKKAAVKKAEPLIKVVGGKPTPEAPPAVKPEAGTLKHGKPTSPRAPTPMERRPEVKAIREAGRKAAELAEQGGAVTRRLSGAETLKHKFSERVGKATTKAVKFGKAVGEAVSYGAKKVFFPERPARAFGAAGTKFDKLKFLTGFRALGSTQRGARRALGMGLKLGTKAALSAPVGIATEAYTSAAAGYRGAKAVHAAQEMEHYKQRSEAKYGSIEKATRTRKQLHARTEQTPGERLKTKKLLAQRNK
jgi:hypothetical protein